jgi:WD40 repeat protein/serine/threonine protein kinase
MSDHNPSAADPFGQIADEFVEAIRRGKSPSVEEFAQRYPEHADAIREILPALVLMERAKSADDVPGQLHRAQASTAALQLRQLGDYQIMREVGRGGMGVVYEAQQLSLGRHVAIKVLPAHALLDRRHLGRFQREARSAAKLHHTNIVPVFGVGEQDGLHYYVMQFIQGLGLDVVLEEMRRLRQARGKQAPTQGELPGRPTNVTQDISAVDVARGLLTGEFRHSEENDEGGRMKDEGRQRGGADSSFILHPSSLSSSAIIHLPGQSEGSTLSESGNQYWQSVAHVGVQVADALAHAASQGVLHRDIKPSNLLLDDTGNVWVTDFGLAKAQSDSDDLTRTGDVVGTLRYMAPERFSGQGDLRSDVYSLGLTLYEMLVLRPAFDEADRNRLVRQVMHDEPVQPRKLNPSVPRDLETVVLKAIARDPAHRYQTPAEMADDLKRFVEDRPVAARRIGTAERLWRWCRRNPLVSALAAGVVLSLLFGMMLALYFAAQAHSEAALAKANEKQAEANEQKALAEKWLSDRRLYDAEINLAYQAWRDSRIAVARDLLQRQVPRNADGADYRDFEWHYLQRLCQLSDFHSLKGHSKAAWKVAFSGDGRRLASSSWDGTVMIWDAVTWDRLFTLRGHTGLVAAVSFSPNGSTLACGDEQGFIKTWDVASGKQILSWKAHADRVQDLSFSPDGRQIASASLDGNVGLWQASTGTALRTLDHTHAVWCVAYAPDGRSLASGGDDGCVKLWDVGSGRQRQTLRHTGDVRCLAYSPDGRLLACGDNHILRVWNPLSGEPVRSFRGHSDDVWGVAFSPDSRRIASCSPDQTVRVWDLGADLETLTLRHAEAVFGLAFQPHGCVLASAGDDGTVRIWDATSTELECLALPGHEGQIMRLAYRPDGRQFASSSNLQLGPGRWRSELRVWDADKRHGLRTFLPPENVMITSIAYSADNRWLAASLCQASSQPQSVPAQIKLWNAATGIEQGTLPGHTPCIRSLAFGPDGRLASGGDDHTIRIWDVDTMRPLRTLFGHGRDVTAVAFSSDGRLASGSFDKTVQIWDLTVGEEPVALLRQPGSIDRLAFSPSGRELASACADSVPVWDTTTMDRKLVLKGKGTYYLAYTPSGERIATADEAGIKIWDARTGIELLTLPGHYLQANFSPDGTRLIAGLGSSLHVWDRRPLTTEVREEYEARAVVRFHFAARVPRTEVLRSIREDPLLRESVRARAVALAVHYTGAAPAR